VPNRDAWLLVQKPGSFRSPHDEAAPLEENIGAAAVELAPDDLREIESTISRVTVQGTLSGTSAEARWSLSVEYRRHRCARRLPARHAPTPHVVMEQFYETEAYRNYSLQAF